MTRTELEEKVFQMMCADMAICFEYPEEELLADIRNASLDDLLGYIEEND